MFKVASLGQVFTPQNIVATMLQLRKNYGSVLEPSCGDGVFFNNIANCTGIEIDKAVCPNGAYNIDFFDFSLENKFDTIIGNPPYVRFQDILPETKRKLDMSLFDERSNLYLFFIEKSIKHLSDRGELIFITPRDFLKASSAMKLNKFIFENGTITDYIELGDQKIFNGYSPNCAIWRFEKKNYSKKTNVLKEFLFQNGQLLFTNSHYPIKFKDIFFVKVGAVSGLDAVFSSDELGNMDFVCSHTFKTGETRRMLFNQYHPYLEAFKDKLINRGIKKFGQSNWWTWGRSHFISNKKRIYVNCKTRRKAPFFLHQCNNYDGSILAIFPKNQDVGISILCDMLNNVNWFELGFVCDGRYIFSQKSLENSVLPAEFKHFLYKEELL